MNELTVLHLFWALILGAISAVSLPLGSLVGLNLKFKQGYIATFAAFGAGALIAALSVELVAPTCLAIEEQTHGESQSNARTNFYALIVGGFLGGILFVSLDTLVNVRGGYLRKRATTLAHLAARERIELQQQLGSVFALPPFHALPEELRQDFANRLTLLRLKQDEDLPDSADNAVIVLEGELEIEIENRIVETAGSGTFVGALALFIPSLARHSQVRAKTDSQCLVLRREEVDQLRALSSKFDRACRVLAEQRIELLERQLVQQLQQAVEWSQSAAGAIRTGTEVPELAIRRIHTKHHGSPMAVWLGILLDGIPESLVIGAGLYLMLIQHPDVDSLSFFHVIPYTLIAGLFLSNFPEALSSSANMLAVGLERKRIFWMWFALMVTTSIGAALGFLLAGLLSETWLVFAQGVAAGAMLTMITAAMIPEAAAHGRPSLVGLSALAGFLTAVLFKLFE